MFLFRYPLVSPAAALVQRFGYRAEQFHIGMAIIVLVKCPSFECARTELHEFFFSRCLGNAYAVLLSDCMMYYFLMVIILVRKVTAGKAEPRPIYKGLTGRPGAGNGRHKTRYIPLSPCPLRLRWQTATQGRTATPAKGFYKCFSVSSL